MNKIYFLLFLLEGSFSICAQSYPPAAGIVGTTAMHKDSSAFIAWATGGSVIKGYINISDTSVYFDGDNIANFGSVDKAFGKATGITTETVSLGDGGEIILRFDYLIQDGNGPDFAVFENAVTQTFLELAFVEVSSDGVNFVRFPSHSETETTTQVSTFGNVDPRMIHNFAGKYRAGFGTPFDLSELPNSSILDKQAIRFVKLIDVVGTINPMFASYDSYGNIVNDPFPTPFNTGGFDLDGIGVINGIIDPELSVKENLSNHLKVYPTAFSTEIQINSEELVEVKLMDISGKIIAIDSGSVFTMQTSNVLAGIYLLHVSKGNESVVFKLMK